MLRKYNRNQLRKYEASSSEKYVTWKDVRDVFRALEMLSNQVVNYPLPKGKWASNFNEQDLVFFKLFLDFEYLPEVLFSACIGFLCSVGI